MIQRQIESLSIPTVSITVAKDVTAAIKAPRALFLPWPMGHHFGVPFHQEIQRRVILEALDLVESVRDSGTIQDLIIKWSDVRRQARVLSEQGRNL